MTAGQGKQWRDSTGKMLNVELTNSPDKKPFGSYQGGAGGIIGG